MADDEEELRQYIRKIVKEEGGGGGGGSGGGGNDGSGRGGSGVDVGEFAKFINAAKGMKEALTSDVDKALSTAVSTRIVEQVVPSMSQQPRGGSGWFDSGAAIAFFSKLPEQLVTLTDVLFTRLGPDRAGRLVDGLENKFLSDGSVIRNDSDKISSFDPDNPIHLHQFMALRNINDLDVAKRTLVAEKAEIMKKMSSGAGAANDGGSGANAGLIQTLESQNSLLKDLVQARTEDRQVISHLFNEVKELKKDKGVREEVGNSFNVDGIKDSKHGDGLGVKKEEVKPEEEMKPEDWPKKQMIPREDSEEINTVSSDRIVKTEKTKESKDKKESEAEEVSKDEKEGEDEKVSEELKNEDDKKAVTLRKKSGSKPVFE